MIDVNGMLRLARAAKAFAKSPRGRGRLLELEQAALAYSPPARKMRLADRRVRAAATMWVVGDLRRLIVE